MPTRRLTLNPRTYDDALRPIQPLVDLDSSKPNRCRRGRCQRPVAYVHTWRTQPPPNGAHRDELLCEHHAANLQTLHALQQTLLVIPDPEQKD